MSRANFVIIIVLVGALAGMFFWTLSIHNRQAAMGGSGAGGASGPGAGSEMTSRVEALEDRLLTVDQGQRALRADLGILEGRVEKIGSMTEAQADALQTIGAGAAVPGSSVVEGGGELATAIEQVIADREAKERKERLEGMARRMSRFLLSEIDATDDQRDAFVNTITSYYEEREAVRKRLEAESADAQRREIAYGELDQRRNDEVQRIFGSADFAKIEERLNRTRRGMDGRGGGGRRTGGGGAGGGRR